MGLDANVLCVGKFSKEVEDHLDYSYDCYEDTTPGMLVTTHTFGCNTSDQSRRLAAALGAEVWDFDTHYITEDKVKWDKLGELSAECLEWDESNIGGFRKLLNAGFICIYQPNG